MTRYELVVAVPPTIPTRQIEAFSDHAERLAEHYGMVLLHHRPLVRELYSTRHPDGTPRFVPLALCWELKPGDGYGEGDGHFSPPKSMPFIHLAEGDPDE